MLLVTVEAEVPISIMPGRTFKALSKLCRNRKCFKPGASPNLSNGYVCLTNLSDGCPKRYQKDIQKIEKAQLKEARARKRAERERKKLLKLAELDNPRKKKAKKVRRARKRTVKK